MNAEDYKKELRKTLECFHSKEACLSDEPIDALLECISKCDVFLPENIDGMKKNPPGGLTEVSGKCKIICEDTDSFTAACRMYNGCGAGQVLVLNFANPYYPGGGVRRGAKAQEEDLCRRSSLLLSLESDWAEEYYEYNWKHMQKDFYGNDYGTHAMLLTPDVRIIKDRQYRMCEGNVGVLTVAAPIIRDKENLSEEYVDILFERILGIFVCAAYYGYTHLVLGAWGCGAFGNEPEAVAGLFRDAIDGFEYGGKKVDQWFEEISFAVPYNERRPWNYMAFQAMFGE